MATPSLSLPEKRPPSLWTRLTHSADLLLALGVMSIILVLVLPLAPILLDILLALSIAFSVLVLFVALFTQHPLDFSAFPTILLIATLYRLSLNVASTRLILGEGHRGGNPAGAVIQSFGEFVVAGNFVVGIIIFLILVIINFVVITKGAGRIAEVAARFTLDAMPGKQMAIDADLNAGVIDDVQAQARRVTVQREADFYGAMDGASKFVRGDAIASLIITAVNITGGLIIGVLQHGMAVEAAAQNYTRLTVGDGLVSQLPALIVSVAAGIAVTKAGMENVLSEEMRKQLLGNYRALGIAAAVLGAFALLPGMPFLPLIVVTAVLGLFAYQIYRSEQRATARAAEAMRTEQMRLAEEKPENIEALLPIDPMGIELGYGLIPLVDAEQDGEMIERIKSIRRQMALEMGFIVPSIHIKDNLELAPGAYSIIIKSVEVGRGELMLGHVLAMKTGDVDLALQGVETIEPAFGLPALWIEAAQQEEAQLAGYTVVDLPTAMATHLMEIIRAHAPEFLGRQETQHLLDQLATKHPKVIEELVPGILTLGQVQKVLQNLLHERVSIRDLHTVLETLADTGPATKDPRLLTEYVRQAMARTITRQYQTNEGLLPLLTLSAQREDQVTQALQASPQGTYLGLDPQQAQGLIEGIEAEMTHFSPLNYQPILLCSPLVRPHLKQLTERFIPSLVVLSHNEIASDVRIEKLGTVA